jgi:hypothetical protein
VVSDAVQAIEKIAAARIKKVDLRSLIELSFTEY